MFVRKLTCTVLCCVYAVAFLIVSAGFLNGHERYELRLDYKLKFYTAVYTVTDMVLVLKFFNIC